MYSPKVREDLIPRIYRAAKECDIPMTVWVNQAVEKSLSEAPPKTNHTTNGRVVIMNAVQTDRVDRRQSETFVIAKSDNGYRVCSPLTPAKQYTVTGVPESPQCTCPNFVHPDRPPDWQCEHIVAVLTQFSGTERATLAETPVPAPEHGSTEPPPHTGKNGNGKAPYGRNGKGAEMLLKRSVSPDGRIDSLSVEFSCPLGAMSNGEIHAQAERLLGLQTVITAGFLKANGKNGNGNKGPHHDNGSKGQEHAVPARLIGVGTMNTRFGRKPVLNILVGDRVLKFFGTEKELAEAVKAAGHADVVDQLAEGTKFDLPCRAVTKPSGKYTNVTRLYPSGNGSAEKS